MNFKLTRRFRLPLAQLLAALMLFSQIAVAAHACMLAQPGIAGMQQTPTTEPCDGVPTDEGSCLAHCLNADQTSNSSTDFCLPAALPATPTPALAIPRKIELFPGNALLRPTSTSPPLQILFCSFQT
jgi:hypothetical protein